MKHSHSCQSMPVGPKLSDITQESPQIHADTSFESSPKFLSKSSPSNSASSSEEQKSQGS